MLSRRNPGVANGPEALPEALRWWKWLLLLLRKRPGLLSEPC